MAAGNDLHVVVKKVKRFEQYAEKSENEQIQLAEELTNHQLLFNRFGQLLKAVDEEIEAATKDDEANFAHSTEFRMAHMRAKHGMARVCHLPVKLFLSRMRWDLPAPSVTSKLFRFFFKFGALHAGLVVGDIRIEWGRESLIDPQWEDDYMDEDFVATVHQQGDWAYSTSAYGKKFSLADRERSVKDKIDLIIESAKEKRQLITNLVEVIVKYNRMKHYNLFTCNCQHFVLDAMSALGIKEIPKFSGQLDDYLHNLKMYKVDTPEEFTNHAALDAYVKQKLKTDLLTQHDMEYLLVHYHRLHMNSMPDDADEEWQCDVESCQFEYLAEKVDRQALLCHQFLKQRASVQRPTSLPTISEVEDSAGSLQTRVIVANKTGMSVNENGAQSNTQESAHEPNNDHLQQDVDMARRIAPDNQQDLIQAYASEGFYSKVTTKLRKLPEYTGKGDREIHDLVETLTAVELFREKYDCFQAIVEEPSKHLAVGASQDKELIDRTQLHFREATEKVSERYTAFCKFPVKLVMRVKPTQQGAALSGGVVEASLHAALLVSDHLFEWDESSLVIPSKVDLTKQPALTTGILHGSEWFTYIINQRTKLDATISSPPDRLHDQEISLMFDLTTKRDDLINAVIKIIVDYNRNKVYHHRKCNNRHFIRDVTRALGVKKLPALGASLKQQLEKSKRRCSRKLSRTELANHADLDAYVSNLDEETLNDLAIVDLEYLVGKYFHCHLGSWELCPDPDQWSCQEVNCQLTKVEEQLERRAFSGESSCLLL